MLTNKTANIIQQTILQIFCWQRKSNNNIAPTTSDRVAANRLDFTTYRISWIGVALLRCKQYPPTRSRSHNTVRISRLDRATHAKCTYACTVRISFFFFFFFFFFWGTFTFDPTNFEGGKVYVPVRRIDEKRKPPGEKVFSLANPLIPYPAPIQAILFVPLPPLAAIQFEGKISFKESVTLSCLPTGSSWSMASDVFSYIYSRELIRNILGLSRASPRKFYVIHRRATVSPSSFEEEI